MKIKQSPNEIKNHINEGKVNVKSQEKIVKNYQAGIDSILKEVKSLKRVQEIDKAISVLDVKKEDEVKKKKELEIEKSNIYNGNYDLRDQEKIKKELTDLDDKLKKEKDPKKKIELQAQIDLQKGKVKSLDQIIKEKLSEKDKIQEKINSEISLLDDHKEVLNQNEALKDSKTWWGRNKKYFYGGAATVGAAFAINTMMPNLFGNKHQEKDSDKNGIEQKTPDNKKQTQGIVDTLGQGSNSPTTHYYSGLNDGKHNHKASVNQENKNFNNKYQNNSPKPSKSNENINEKQESEANEEFSKGYRGDFKHKTNFVNSGGKIVNQKTTVEKGGGPETQSQNLTSEEFNKYKSNLVKVGKAQKNTVITQEKITDQKKIDALNKMSQIGKEAGFSNDEIKDNIEKTTNVKLKKAGKAEEHFSINGVELKNSHKPVSEKKPGDNYYEHNGYWYEYPNN